MEALENSMVEGAILWLVQTILENLSISGKLDEWIRHVGLTEVMKKLRTEVERIETVVAAVKGRANGNKPLARSLARLRELMYDADDAVDELDYFRLQQQVEGGGTACANNDADGTDLDGAELVVDGTSGRDDPNIPSSSKKRKNRSKAWDHFEEVRDRHGKLYEAECKSCRKRIKCGGERGTNGLTKHLGENGKCLREPPSGDHQPTPTSASDGTPNGITDATLDDWMRTDEASALNITASTYRWNKADSSKKIHQIILELQGLRGTVTEFFKDSVASSDQYQSNTLDTRLRTTSLGPRKMYGRDKEKDYIIRVITAAESDVIAVLPIVGIAGIGKTAFAQLVYNDPKVESQFERMWVCVGYNFDEVTLTREMLDFSLERKEGSPKIQDWHQGISGLGRLHEILKANMQCRSKRFLLILDDVWDNLDDSRWRRLLLPLKSSHVKGNVILVTTRDLSVAQRIGTEELIKLDVLDKNDFWLLYKSFAFGDDNYGELPSLNNIGQQIAEKLKRNPLAAETAGKILRERLDLEHWSRILKNEDWKSLQLKGGIMSALKLSYDQLPYHLQQCFLYCSIFPNNHHFLAKDLVCTWISLGFVRCTNSNKKLEEIGRECLTNLVNLGFLEQVEISKYISRKTCYVLCGIMHEFGRLVSKTECATIDGLESKKILPTIRHLSIVIDSAYLHDQYGDIVRNEKFEKNLQSIFEQAVKLRTLVLLGRYDPYFKSFQVMLPKVQNLQVLRIFYTGGIVYSFQGNLVSPVHLRCLKVKFMDGCFNEFPQTLSKLYHIQVLDINDTGTILRPPMGTDHLASRSVYYGIIGKLTCLREVNCAGCDITKLESMRELVQLRVYRCRNIITRDVAYAARLRDKPDLETLQLSWMGNLSQDECDAARWSEDTESDVLEGLEPHHNLKYLQVLGYCGAESPAWLGSSVSLLQTLHLEDCGEWGELRFLGSLPFLTKLKLKNMQKIEDISIPSLIEELELTEMPKLERCSCDSVRDLNSSLRVLKIVWCSKLEVFPLFESCGIEQNSWLPFLREFTINGCPHLVVRHPLPPSSRTCNLSIARVSELPNMNGSSDEELTLEGCDCEFSDELIKPSTNILAWHNLRVLSSLTLRCLDYPIFSSFEGFRQLINLKSLFIGGCKNLFSSNVPQEDTYEDLADENISALPSLSRLEIYYSSIEGMWLSVLLRNLQALEELTLSGCDQITGLFIEKNEDSEESNLKSAPEASSSGDPGDAAVTGSSRDGILRIPSKFVSSLKKMCFRFLSEDTFQGNKEVFSKFTSLEELSIQGCPRLVSCCVHKDRNDELANGRWLLPQSLVKLEIGWSLESEETLRLCFPGHLTGLKTLNILGAPCLESLQLQYCTALEELVIGHCESLTALEGLPSLGGLRSLEVSGWPHLVPSLERVSSEGYDMRPQLEILVVHEYCILTKSLCEHLISLKCLKINSVWEEATRLTDEQERALQLLTSLQELRFDLCWYLEDLPNCLHSLPSLKKLGIEHCPRLSRLPEKGLPPSLEELEIGSFGSGRKELTDQCRTLATSKLKVKINEYVNP